MPSIHRGCWGGRFWRESVVSLDFAQSVLRHGRSAPHRMVRYNARADLKRQSKRWYPFGARTFGGKSLSPMPRARLFPLRAYGRLFGIPVSRLMRMQGTPNTAATPSRDPTTGVSALRRKVASVSRREGLGRSEPVHAIYHEHTMTRRYSFRASSRMLPRRMLRAGR